MDLLTLQQLFSVQFSWAFHEYLKERAESRPPQAEPDPIVLPPPLAHFDQPLETQRGGAG